MPDASPRSTSGSSPGDGDSEVVICRHCQVRIIRVNYQGGARWMHIRNMDLYSHCKTTTAGPGSDAVLTGQVPVSRNPEMT